MKKLKKITYIEDEPDIQRIAKICLEKFGGYEVSIFSNATEALEGIVESGPDLILLDIMLPGMDGKELFGKLKELDSIKNTPIVFITAKSNYVKDPSELVELGASGVLEKPFDPVSLTQSMEKFWRDHVEGN